MSDRYVESKSLRMRIPCDGPLDVQLAHIKLWKLGATDIELGFVKKLLRPARPEAGRKRGRK